MTHLTSHISARTRLFEYIRQERMVARRTQRDKNATDPEAIAAFQRLALQSLDRSAH